MEEMNFSSEMSILGVEFIKEGIESHVEETLDAASTSKPISSYDDDFTSSDSVELATETVEVVDTNNNNKFNCNYCSKTYSTLTSYNRHKVLHTGEGHQCNTCHKIFYSRFDLRDHVLTQDDEKHFRCNICTKAFQTRGGLNSHKRMHTADYKYICDHCGEGFIYKSNFEGHKARHENLAPFQCNVCNKGFRYKSSLSRHGCGFIKKFSCDSCGQKFKAKRYLMDHLRAHINPERYQCSKCGTCFKYRGSFHKHRKQTGHK